MALALHALALAIVAALLLFGCASEPKPTEGMQGIVVQSAEGLIGEVQPPKAGGQGGASAQKINCTLAVKQASIVAGEQVDISLSAHFQGSARFDLLCDDEARSLISENTLVLETSCRFDAPGSHIISVSANGQECARAVVEARKKAGGNCSIDGASIEKDLASYYYKWKVDFDGFSGGDTLIWVCDSTVARKTIESDPIWGMPRFELLSCDFPGRPSADYINVSISGVPCGKISTR